jgi:DNA-binding transcriptional ArsR family regulator
MTTDMGFFVPHFFLSVDMGVPSIIGAEALSVYDVLRRHVCRDDRQSRAHRLADLYRSGHLVCSLSQGEIADFTDMSDRNIRRHVARLKTFGWIETYGFISHTSSVPVYRLGGLVSARKGEGFTESFFADEWIQRAKSALTKHTRKTLKDADASYRDLATKDRVAFVRGWAERESERVVALDVKRPRAVGEDARPGDDETQGDDDPTAQGRAHSATS